MIQVKFITSNYEDRLEELVNRQLSLLTEQYGEHLRIEDIKLAVSSTASVNKYTALIIYRGRFG